jgi:glycosyltransferase involved in cell wall biosynthesis/SAM-dependent methyltransferase
MPNEKALKAYYDGESYFQGEAKGSYTDYDRETEAVLSLFRDFLLTIPNAPGKKILDIGCAFGTHLAIAAEQGWEAWGVELSDHARETALSRHGEKIHVIEAIDSLPNLEFDLIVMLDVVEHLPNPYELFIELFLQGVIGKKTQLIITTPNARSVDAIADPSGWAYRHPPAHLVYFSANSLKLLLTNLDGIEIAIQGIYPVGHKEICDYPDENSAFNQKFKNYAGLMSLVQGFDTSLHKLLALFKNKLIPLKNSEIKKLYQETFAIQKEVTQKHALEELCLNAELIHQAQEIVHLNEVVEAKNTEVSYQAKEIAHLNEVVEAKNTEVSYQSKEITLLNEVVIAKDVAVSHQAQEIARLNEETEAKDLAVSHQAQEITHLNEEIEAKDLAVSHQVQEIARLNEQVVAKDGVISHQSQGIAHLSDVVKAKDVAITHQSQEIAQLNNVISHQSQEIAHLNQEPQAKDATIAQQAQEIGYLNQLLEAKQLELWQKEQEILSVHRAKWYRLGNALKTRPMTLHNLARIAYLSAGLITSKTLRTKIAPIISIFRQQYLNARQASLDEIVKNSSYLITPPEAVQKSDVGSSQFLSIPSNTPYTVEVLRLGINSKILLVAHDFSRTGAPYAVLYLARAIFSLYGIRPVVICPNNGSIREEFEQEGFPVIVDPLLFKYKKYSSEVCDFVASFERVIVTSLASFDFIRYFRGIGNHLTWWIHETNAGFTAVASMTDDLPLLFAACESVWLGSPLCFPFALRYSSPDKLHLLLYGCEDTTLPHRPHPSGKIVFSIVGSVEPRKGQDIFLEAIERLSEELRSKAAFRIIGSPLPYDDSVSLYKKVCAKALLMPEVDCIENMPPDKLLEFYAETNVLVSASRDDPMPIVITQGLMFSKVCLCSSVIGHAQLLEDNKDALIFTSGSAEELSEKMAWLIQNPDELMILGIAGRKVYEKYFLMSRFVNNVGNLIRDSR